MGTRFESPESYRTAILDEVVRAQCATPASLALIEEALEKFPASAALWCLHGDLLQLCLDDDRRSPEDAADSYLKATELEPNNPEPYESLANYFDGVMDDPQQAAEYFRKAIALGAGDSAREGLVEVLAELDEL